MSDASAEAVTTAPPGSRRPTASAGDALPAVATYVPMTNHVGEETP